MNRLRSEIGLLSYLKKLIIFQQNDLKQWEGFQDHLAEIDQEFPFHIYFICKRPRILVVPESFRQTKDKFFLTIKIQKELDYNEIDLEFENQFNEEVDCKSSYPFSYIEFYGKETGRVIPAKISGLIDDEICLTTFNTSILDFEILYIGKAFGKEGERTAIARLSNHSTLQKIYSECHSEYPDNEIYLAMLNFGKYSLLDLSDSANFSNSEMKEDWERFDTITQKKFPKIQEINYIEAALIKYFQPPINEKRYRLFPSERHSSYRDCFKLKLNSMIIELGVTDILQNKMFTNHVSPSPRYIIQYHFTNDTERKKLFNLGEEEE